MADCAAFAPITFGSVCSGIEAASVAWKPLGWRASFLSEIEAFPRAVLKHHYPKVPLHGDFTTIRAGEYRPIDLLVGGTPCQSFSVAGLRGGLDDERGNLALEYLRLAQRLRPRWLVWENVPGVLSSNGGRDFGAILGGLVELGYGFAYRVLDAQYVRVDGFARAVPQRRRRVFVVGHLGDWRRAAAVLSERESLRGDPAPRREAGKGVARAITAGFGSGSEVHPEGDMSGLVPEVCGALNHSSGHAVPGNCSQDWNAGMLIPQVSMCLNAGGMGRSDSETETILPVTYGLSTQQEPKWAKSVSPTLAMPSKSGGGQVTAVAFDMAQITSKANRARVHAGLPASTLNAAGQMHVAMAIQERAVSENPNAGPDGAGIRTDGAAYTLEARTVPQAVAFSIRNDAFRDGEAKTPSADAEGRVRLRNPSMGIAEEVAPTMDSSAPHSVARGWAVRRLTPTECERLQGFPDGYTNIPYRGKPGAPDGPRYKALGNSMAVNVMRWIGMRIQMVEAHHAL